MSCVWILEEIHDIILLLNSQPLAFLWEIWKKKKKKTIEIIHNILINVSILKLYIYQKDQLELKLVLHWLLCLFFLKVNLDVRRTWGNFGQVVCINNFFSLSAIFGIEFYITLTSLYRNNKQFSQTVSNGPTWPELV